MIFYIYYVLLTFMHSVEGEHPLLDLNTPSFITDIRLVNGMGLFDGILELQINGTWADVCYGPNNNIYHYELSRINARVVCTTLFNLPYKRTGFDNNSNVHTIKLYCYGSETNIQECIFGPEVCFPHMRLYIACNDQYFPWNITDIRLVNGTGPYDGRVELKYKDQWGTICNRWWNTEVGDTLCGMLNLSFTARYSTAKFGQGTGPVLFGMVVCRYNPYNRHINNCYSMEQPSKWFCDHGEDSSIICTDCGLPNITNGWITSSNGSIMTVTCNTGYVPTTYNIECLNNSTWLKNETCKLNDCGLPNITNGWITSSNGSIMTVTCNTGYVPATYNTECLNNGTWSTNETCKLYGYPLNITDMRLADGIGKYDGRLEVKVNDTWGTVCSGSFTYNEGEVICSMLNSAYRSYTDSKTWYSSGSGPIWIDKLDCNGSETHINQCKYNVLNTCNHSLDIAVICNGAPLNISSIRLTNGTGPYNGRVELLADGTWGTICNHRFDLNEAKTLCNMMNLSLLTYYATSVYGVGSGPTHISELSCNGIYNDVNLCSYRTPSTYYPDYCTKNNDVSLECTECEFPNITNGQITSSNGSIMTVTCNTGYVPTTYNIECLNNSTWVQHETCKLYGYPLDITDMRLSDGVGKYDGRLEVKVNDTWGTVCSGSFTYNAGEVICNMLNSAYRSYTDSKTWYSSGSGPIYIDKLDCNGSETHINQCKYNVLNTCNHSSDIAVICNGAPLNISSIRLTNGTGPYNGRVELLVDDSWGTICNDRFGFYEAKTLCNMMNLSLLSIYTTPVYEVDPVPRHIIWLSCYGIYNDINECFYRTPYLDCRETHGVSLACTGGCGLPNITNGRITVSNGRIITVTCNTGYVPTTYNIECLNNSTWLQNETCKLYDCGLFVPPLNGYHTGDISTTFNSTIVFSCNSNYLLVGESVMHCNSDGKWSSEVPSCLLLSEIGGACKINEHCKTVGAVCKESRCECITGIYDSRTDKCDTMPLYPYGPNEGDTIHNDWKQCAKPVKFELGLPLCGKSHSKIFVCAHGVVSFGRGYNTPTPPKNITNAEKLGHDILAPFHAHFSPSKGMVYYRSHNILDSYVLLKDRNETTDIVSKIHQFGNAPSSFEANFILIATWENVRPEDVDFDITNSGGSTFQLVMASNGELTYSFYIYANGMMNWMSKRSKYAPVWVGHSCNTDTSSTFHTSFTDSALKLDRNAVHRGVSGIVFKPLVPVEKSTKNNNVSCVTWYQENKHEKQQLDLINNRLPQCPCDIALARWDPWFWQIESWNLYNGRKKICVDMFPGRIYRPYGKSCCYDYQTFVWIDERPISGGLYRYHPENTVDHYKQDILPKQVCCSPLTPYCKYFYELRPTGTCYRESPYNFGSFWGDPHFLTLDGMSYTFNGLGEYTLLQIETENITFNLQARTQRAVKLDGNLSDATIFTAFAARDENNASFHVEINRAGNGFNIYGNGKDITKQFNDTSYEDLAVLEVPNRTLLISKREQTLVVLFPSSGISLNVSISVEMLSMNAIIPKALSNLTTGLLGNYNGLKDDDFILPNGTILPSNITEREIFNYGKTWEIEETMSAFVYPEGKNHFDYHNASYIPRFLDEASPDKIEEARKVCNGSTDNECVFDFVFTDREEIATSTNQLKENRDQTISQMAKVVPEIIGCEPINATYEKIVSCPINIDDGTYVEFLTNNVNASYNRDSSTILYYQNKNEPVDVRVVTINEQGRSSPVFVMEILLCTGCSGNGVCTNTPRLDHRNTETFKYATCECEPDYEGPDCETLFNACFEQPCSLNRDCKILVGHKRTEFNRTYICDICPDGYFGNDTYNDTCTDIDECNDENPPCDHKCTNIDGSYECACTFGYRPDPRNKDKCIDINECEDLNTPHNCSQNCTNTDGSFVCSCFKGYTLDTESEKCFKNNVTDDPCFSKNCSRTNGGCRITDNDTAVCFCESGYELVSNNECIDIDECDGNVCSQLCNNSIGGFECSCFTGYTLIGMTTCQECEVGFWGKECMNECMCKGEGVKTCDPVKGCLCNDGWKGETCQEDINECNETLNACNDPKKDCVNSLGSFSCSCFEGFRENTDGVCEDFDECSIPSLHGCDQICRNSIGSYFCECESGFAMKNSKCENINECEIKTHGCEQVCDDNPGSYNCYCHFGYILNDDRRTCTKSSDPCLTFHNLNCSHYCYVIQERSSAECKCKDGFALGSDNQTCTDINECTEKTHDCVQADCKNTNGSYTCDCSIGFKLQNDERTCTECDDFHYGVNCAMECSCLHGVCNKTHGCECYKGWQDNNCDVDINECTTGQVVCDLVNEQCINTLGSAECHCLQGYTRNESNHCVDIDECSDSRLNSCDQTCINNLGNYTCECQTGFIFMDRTCKDIDECDNKKSKCEQLCENTIGSYNCLCEDGFRLNLTDRESCIPSTECLNPEQCGGNSTCFRNNDEDICKCIKGFQNMSSSCKDINECNSTRRLCHQSCSNTVGSYVCSCHAGYYLLNDYTTCAVCEAGTYGDECKKTCFCNDEHTESCDHVTGACICKPGWEGTICDVDKDECTNTSICPQHSTCNNTYGNYNCICNIGYYSEMCLVCDNKHYGNNCSAECACDYNKTKFCNHINGSCECMEGWNGDTCSDDVDDCKDIDICTEKSNSNCENTDGAYRCVCKDGFRELAHICEDIDECIDGTNICEYDCVNTEGNYSCQCQAGYHGDGYNCTIDKCTRLVDTGECDVNDCVIENETAVCKRKSGGLSLPQIIGIGAGGIIVLFITVSVIVCVRSRTNRKPLNRRSLPETTFRTDDPSYMKESNERQPVMTNLGYLTWKTMLTRLKSNESEGTQNEERYKIPRVHIRRPRKKFS